MSRCAVVVVVAVVVMMALMTTGGSAETTTIVEDALASNEADGFVTPILVEVGTLGSGSSAPAASHSGSGSGSGSSAASHSGSHSGSSSELKPSPGEEVVWHPLFPWGHPEWTKTHKAWIMHHQRLFDAIQKNNAQYVGNMVNAADVLATIQRSLPYGYFPRSPYPSFPVSSEFPYQRPFYPEHPGGRFGYTPFYGYLPPRWPSRRPPIVPGLKPVFSRPIDFPVPVDPPMADMPLRYLPRYIPSSAFAFDDYDV